VSQEPAYSHRDAADSEKASASTFNAQTIHFYTNKEIVSQPVEPAAVVSPGPGSPINAERDNSWVGLTERNTPDSNSEDETHSTQLQGDTGVQALDTIEDELDSKEDRESPMADPQPRSTGILIPLL
jgi:hypothetical protein